MKIILSLLILISLFFNLLAETKTCPRLNYIYWSSGSIDSCKCLNIAVKKTCGISVKCDNLSWQPIFTKDGGKMTSNCCLVINYF